VQLAKDYRMEIHDNLERRLLDDVLRKDAGGYFLAEFHMGSMLTARTVLFEVDPKSVPDQVQLMTLSDEGVQTWVAYAMRGGGAVGVPMRVTGEALDVSFEKSGKITWDAVTTMTVRRDGLQVLPLNLYPTLRVAGVFDENGDPLEFIQEKKDADPQFAVILAKPATKGDVIRVLTKYSGPDAVRRDGNAMYYLEPGARENWYPAGEESLGGFASFLMTFHIPKGLDIIATGRRVSSKKEDGGTSVVWATDSPIPVAGFNLGEFKSAEEKTPAGFDVMAYANTELPDSLLNMANGSLGSMSTTGMLKVEASQGSAAIQVYSDYFGKLPYDHVALTEQSACNFGQSWPMLVYLPICAFWDDTIKHSLGLLEHDASYWEEVTPHEVAHQWWGQEVGFDNYRDQWMSEGFANFSVSLYLMATNKTPKEFQSFWKEQHRNLVEKNQFGKRPVDIGPLTMGERVSNEKTGNVYQDLIYSKGAYILHMLEIQYWTPKLGEAPFKHSMQAFVEQYRGKAATTEDLKASFEQTMPKWLDVDGNGKLDWFFNEYVYGTELPHYEFAADAKAVGDTTEIHFRLTQSNVSNSFVMPVPVYAEMENGQTVRIFNVTMRGDTTKEQTVKMGKSPSPVKRLVINYYEDVLCE
jgi:hypothetical protein